MYPTFLTVLVRISLGGTVSGISVLEVPCRGLSVDGSTLRVDDFLLLLAVHHSGLMHITYRLLVSQFLGELCFFAVEWADARYYGCSINVIIVLIYAPTCE
jgi:hypothetical protein